MPVAPVMLPMFRVWAAAFWPILMVAALCKVILPAAVEPITTVLVPPPLFPISMIWVLVPEVLPIWIVLLPLALVPMLMPPVPSVFKFRAVLVPPEAMLRAAVLVSVVELPRLTMPLPACRVRPLLPPVVIKLEVALEAIRTAPERELPIPTVPVLAPVILPVHAKLPVEPSSVQPVDPEPPARTIPPEPTAPPILRVVATLLNRFWVVALPTMVPA